MPKILAVNNYPTTERFDKLRRCLAVNGAAVTVTGREDCSAPKFDAFDGVVLSGSPDMLSAPGSRAKYAAEIAATVETRVPVLGVCLGHQLIAVAFGSEVVGDAHHVRRFVRTDVLANDALFGGVSRPTMLLESRSDIVKSLPRGFRLLARSATSEIAAMKHGRLLLYGVQSHPERYTAENPDGKRVVGNFVRMLE